MKEIIIYQTDNRDYSFMPWEYAKEKFNMNVIKKFFIIHTMES